MPKENNDRVFMQNAIKTLATNIRFASVDNPVQTLVITSSVPNEGKSTIAIALAQAIATGGQSVLLVECDMRRRSIANMMAVHARTGIYSVLSGAVTLEDAVIETSTRGMYFLDCEPHIPNPVDILSSKRFHRFAQDLRQEYDFVIFDTPPLSAFVDAAVLSTTVDATLLVARQNFVKRDELTASYAQLQKAGANVIGVVMNYCENEKSDYYYSYYAKDGKKGSERSGHDSAPSVVSSSEGPSSPAAGKRPQTARKPQVAAAAQRSATTASQAQGASGLKPIPTKTRVSPESTAQFLAGTNYRPRTYTED